VAPAINTRIVDRRKKKTRRSNEKRLCSGEAINSAFQLFFFCGFLGLDIASRRIGPCAPTQGLKQHRVLAQQKNSKEKECFHTRNSEVQVLNSREKTEFFKVKKFTRSTKYYLLCFTCIPNAALHVLQMVHVCNQRMVVNLFF